jgi:hypothetical protein
MKPVNLKELADAFESIGDSDGWDYYVDKRDGKIYSLERRHLAIAGFYLDGDDYEVYPAEQDEIEAARAFTERYDREYVIDFTDKYEVREYDIMEEFADGLPSIVANKINGAIRGKGAFRRFRETVARLGLLDEWCFYRDNAMMERARRWCVNNGIDYEPKQDTINLGDTRGGSKMPPHEMDHYTAMPEAEERGEARTYQKAESKRAAAIEALKAQGVSDEVIAWAFGGQ